jgi:predicted nuclease of predicted toxin-antitoxin system
MNKMRIVVDNALSPKVAFALRNAGHDAIHVKDIGMASSTDNAIFEYALTERRVIISADTDFAVLLSQRRSSKPSVILFRGSSAHRPEDQIFLLINLLPKYEKDLESGSVLVIEQNRIRIRKLPI